MIALQKEKHVTTVTNKTTSHDAVNHAAKNTQRERDSTSKFNKRRPQVKQVDEQGES